MVPARHSGLHSPAGLPDSPGSEPWPAIYDLHARLRKAPPAAMGPTQYRAMQTKLVYTSKPTRQT